MLALAAFGIVPNALAADSGSVFLDATYGETFGGSVTNQSGWAAGGGYLWKLDDRRSLGFDLGYVHFGHVVEDSSPMVFSSNEASASAITLGATSSTSLVPMKPRSFRRARA